MKKFADILILEDRAEDAKLLLRELNRGMLLFSMRQTSTKEQFLAELDTSLPDICLLDYRLPEWNGIEAIAAVHERSPDIPCIIVSGTIGEEMAVEVMKHGASDFVLKDRLLRLLPGIERALREAQERKKRKELEGKLLEKVEEIERLTKLVIRREFTMIELKKEISALKSMTSSFKNSHKT